MRVVRWLIETDLWIPLAIVLIGTLVIGGTLYFSGALGFFMGMGDSEAARNAAYDRAEVFLEELREGRHDQAASHVALTGQGAGQDEISEILATEGALRGLSGGQLGFYRRRGETAVISGTLDVAGGQVACDIHLVRRAGEWWVTQLVLSGRPVFAGGR
ncbi:MAG: hypothetical protein WED00_15775 [Aquisalimonadaceae bacterium]